MPHTTDTFAPTIRKAILNALDKYIIPALDSHRILQVLAGPPFDFSPAQCKAKREEPLPDHVRSPLQIIQRWESEHMVAIRKPAFGFVCDGVSYENVGVTQTMAKETARAYNITPFGITTVRLPAPAIICYPPGTPHNDGTPPAEPWPESSLVLGVKLMDESVFVFLCGDINTHSLEITDHSLLQLGLLYFEELHVAENHQGTQGLLLAFMCRLRRYLNHNRPQVGNTAWVKQREMAATSASSTEARHHQLCWDAMDYIQTHLHTSLSLNTIADHVGISGFYLNRIFMHQKGITIMRYVTQTRIEAAKAILCETPERVSDVAKLVGFATDSSFSAVFRKHVGISPRGFRQQHNMK